MGDDQDRLALALELDDHRIEATDQVLVALASRVAVAQLVPGSCGKLLWHAAFDLLVTQAVAYSDLQFISVPCERCGSQRLVGWLVGWSYVDLLHALPAHVLSTRNDLSRLHRTAHGAAPHAQLGLGIKVLADHELLEQLGELVALGRERRVAAELVEHVVLALAMARNVDRPRNDVEVVEVEDDATRHEAIDAIGDDLATDVKDLDVAQVVLETHRLVRLLVVIDALAKVFCVRVPLAG